MRILIICKNFDLGGTEKHVRELANNLAQRNHQVFLVSRPGRQQDHLHTSIKHLAWKLSDLRYLPHLRALTQLIRGERIDIVHGHQRLAISLGARAAHRANIPVLATVHGQVRHDLRSHAIRRILDQVIVVAENRLEHIKDTQLRKKSLVLQNGISFHSSATDWTRPEKFRACYVSRLDKSHFTALKILIENVWPQLGDAELIIIGDGPFRENLEILIKKYSRGNYGGKITALGFQKEVIPHMLTCSLVIGVGRVAIEALGHKIPLLSLNGNFSGEIVSSENYHQMRALNFVSRNHQPPTAQDILGKIRKFLENQDNIETDTAKLNPQVLADFSLEMTVTKMTNQYNKLVEQNNTTQHSTS